MRLLGFILLLVLVVSAEAGNMVPNSSLEVGIGRGWQMCLGTNQPKNLLLTDAYHGSNSIKIVNNDWVLCPPIWLTNGVTYTFSWYEKANQANSGFWTFCKTKTGIGETSTLVTTPVTWTRRTYTVTPTETESYQVGWTHYQAALAWQIDALQCEVGTSATTYAPQSTVEAAIETPTLWHNYFSTDSKVMTLLWWNDGTSTTKDLRYEIFDLWNRQVTNGWVTSVIPAGASTTNFVIPVTNGWQRMTTRIGSVNASWDELTYTICPFAARTGINETGILGTHTQNDVAQCTFLRNVGFSATRTLSPSWVFRWSIIEPSNNAWDWRMDSGVVALSNSPLAVIGVIGAGLDLEPGEHLVPAWAENEDGSINMPEWAQFCSNVVLRYKGSVTNWEIWNEPQQSGTDWIRVAGNYANMLTNAINAIKGVDPNCRIIAMAGPYDEEWTEDVWDLLSTATKAQCDIISYHLYPNDNSLDQNVQEYDNRHAEWRLKFSGVKPIWNSETGTWNSGGMLGNNAIWGFEQSSGYPEWQRSEKMSRSKYAVERISRNFLRSLGNGCSKYFYYDSRYWSRQAVTATQPYSWEYTRTLRPTVMSLVMGTYFLEGFTSVTRVTNSASAYLETYLFEMGSSRVAAVFNNDRITRDITTAQTDFTVYDVMGNTVAQPTGKIRVTKTPQYIVSTGLSVAQMTTVLQGSLATVSDTTGPALSVDIAPSGVWAGGGVFIKFTGIDSQNVNTATYPNNVTFTWKLDSDAYPSYGQQTWARRELEVGDHTLWVRGKDASGNVTEISYVFSSVPEEEPEPPEEPPAVNSSAVDVKAGNLFIK